MPGTIRAPGEVQISADESGNPLWGMPGGGGGTKVDDWGNTVKSDGSPIFVDLNNANDLANLRQNYTQLMAHPEWSDAQVRQYVTQATGGGNFTLGSNANGLTSKVDNSQFMGGLGPLLPLLAMTIATGGAGLGLGGLLEGGSIAGDAFLPGALGADGLGAGAATFGGAGGSLANTFGGGSSLLSDGGLSTLGTTNSLSSLAADAPWNLNPYTIPSGGGMDLTGFLNDDPFGFGGGSIFDVNGGLNTLGTTNGLNPMTDWWNTPMGTSAGGIPFPGQTFDLGNSLNPGTVDLQSVLPNLPSGLQDLIKKLMGGTGAAAGGQQQQGGIAGLLQSLGLGSGLSSVIGSAINSAPVLATLNYARNQNPIDTSGLQQLAATYNPQAQAGMYDVQTASGRNALDSSLTNRGVAGSSFGNFDQASYDTLRGIGRNQLVNQGAATQAGIYGQINSANLQSQQLKNQLLGSGLNALGLMANPNRGITLPG